MTVDLEGVTIRPATAADAADIARVHVASWQSAYGAILPEAFLAGLDPAVRAQQWDSILSGADGGLETGTRVLVAEAEGDPLGFAAFGPSRDEDGDGGTYELYAMYLEPGSWGRGVARELMRSVLAELPQGTPMTLWVLAGNERAQHFYRRHGFAADGVERIDEIGGTPVTELRFRRP
ncbi:GNAT family N-acetyltransferase [Xylanimonas oleitrophica]|uniref:GNAT family N-acetyltransferase n=1 Tax=Xylanimonas oleitrophica TaxID=2607479 RepID=A0A2W5WLT1_9MICO|nr:GNAT family N-acetyltransferase [Xylanimonas oleitrophica]PZR52277.1 GNAT family N-acetyltransferase [Xylanimonas oleitrophica]